MFEFCQSVIASDQSPSLIRLLACPALREAFLRGGLTGVLGLAGLFNLILLFANPRNLSHLIFSAISLAATVAVLLPYALADAGPGERERVEFLIFRAAIPALLFVFVYVLFPSLRHSRPSPLYRAAAACGFYAALPAAAGLIPGALLYAPLPTGLQVAGILGAGLAGLAAGGILLTACFERQQGALVAAAGFALYILGLSVGVLDSPGRAFAEIPGDPNVDSLLPDAEIGGVLGFVLAMVFSMGPNRYQMHRQLRGSRNVLRDANRKLRELDAIKNRYITSSAREMQPPLEAMLDRCLRLIEDPAYRLGPSQLAALSAVMDMARRMIVRNERATTLFAEEGIRAREFDAVNFLELLTAILEEQLPPLRFSLRVEERPASDGGSSSAPGELRVFADPTLIETAFIELAENAASHGAAHRIQIRVRPLPKAPGTRVAEDRVELAFIEPAAGRPAREIRELSGEFRQGSPEAPGIGLGLSLVRRIAENHGSRLEIREQNAHGASSGKTIEFSFSVPRAGAKAMRPPEVEWGLKHLRLLVSQQRFAQADAEARRLTTRFPETRRETDQLLEDARPL